MTGKNVFSITEFARFSRTTRRALIHYDRIGLLEPVSRADNNYRFYSSPQLGVMNLTRTCQEMGMSLTEIIDFKRELSPESAMAMMEKHIGMIGERITEWRRAQKLMETLYGIIKGVRGVDEGTVTITQLPEERVVFGMSNDYSGGRNDDDALLAFYRDCQRRYPNMDMNYPVWAEYSAERIKNRDWKYPDRYYFYNPKGPDTKPGGLYAVGYTRGGYGDSDDAYTRILAYVDENGYEICGSAYEEYPLNEISVTDPQNYLMRVSVSVREKPYRLS